MNFSITQYETAHQSLGKFTAVYGLNQNLPKDTCTNVEKYFVVNNNPTDTQQAIIRIRCCRCAWRSLARA